MNLTPLSSAHAYLQLKLYRSSVPSSPTRSIHSMKEVKDHRAQCGKNSGLICLRQLCLEKFRLKCCLMSMWFFMNFEDKVLQIHLVISLYLIKKYTLLQHMPFPCGSWAPAFFFFFQFWLVNRTPEPGLWHQRTTLRVTQSHIQDTKVGLILFKHWQVPQRLPWKQTVQSNFYHLHLAEHF